MSSSTSGENWYFSQFKFGRWEQFELNLLNNGTFYYNSFVTKSIYSHFSPTACLPTISGAMATPLKLMPTTIFTVFFFLLLFGFTYGRFISDQSNLISDGVAASNFPPFLRLHSAEEEACDPSYGFMPCTTTALGNFFLIVVYGYLMFLAATCLSNGSEMLLQIMGPGIVGGLFLPVLGALPDAMLILGDYNFLLFKFSLFFFFFFL